jgi:hypothetical protein
MLALGKYVVFLFAIFSLVDSSAQTPKVNKKNLTFFYTPNELPQVLCQHTKKRPNSHTWIVKCPFYKKVKVFSVHLIIREKLRETKPTTWYEVLYWVSNRPEDRSVSEFTGTSMNLFFDDYNPVLRKFSLGQMVDNGYADLNLIYRPL